MEERELRDLETMPAQVEDPRLNRTKRYHHSGDLWGELRAEEWVEIEE